MKKTIFPQAAGGLLLIAFAMLAPVTATNAAQGMTAQGNSEDRMTNVSPPSEAGTIPAARPVPPDLTSGAQGPVRTDLQRPFGSDPSLRDQNPLTANGLWETRAGNQVGPPERSSGQ